MISLLQLVVFGVVLALFLGWLVVLAVIVWRSPTKLAETVTAPLAARLDSVTEAIRDNLRTLEVQATITAGLSEQLRVHGEQLRELSGCVRELQDRVRQLELG